MGTCPNEDPLVLICHQHDLVLARENQRDTESLQQVRSITLTNEGGLVIETVLSPHTDICFTCQNTHSRSWRGGSTVESNCGSCKGSQFGSQHPYQAACNSSPRVVSAPSSGLTGHKTCKCIHTQKHIYINFNK